MLAALLGACIVPACGPRNEATATSDAAREERAPRDVTTAPVEVGVWPRVLRVPGELAAFEEATVAAKVPGRVREITVDVGERVKQGQPLARIESREYELGVEQAQAALAVARARLGPAVDGSHEAVDPAAAAVVRRAQAELDDARREHARLQELAAGGISAEADLERAETRLRSAESALQLAREDVDVQRSVLAQRAVELEMARQELANTEIPAPFDGAVVERLVGTGDYVSAGDGVLRIVRDDPVRLRLEVNELEAGALRVGQVVRARIEGTAHEVGGTVTRVAPVIEGRSRTLRVEVDLANPQGELRAGAFARAEIVVDPEARAPSVPESALVTFAGIDKVFTVEDGKAVETRVVVGRREPGRVEILSGLEPGDEVVLSPGGLETGDPVNVGR